MKLKFLKDHRWLAMVSVITALAVTGFVGLTAATVQKSSLNPLSTVKMAPAGEAAAATAHGYVNVVKKVLPAVVNISSSKVVKSPTSEQQFGQDPFFQQFFGNNFFRQFNVPQSRREKALGSGVIVSPDGYILTNNHVIDGATDVTVTLHDKREMKAKVVGTDPRTDIAVVKIEGHDYPSLALADSSKVEVGEVVLAVGDPFGIGQTVTQGIVSAKGRSGLGIEDVEDFIQTDAPINPGNSGGALVDDQGYLIGINTAIVGNSGGNEGIGFAVPINMARHDLDQIVEHGKVMHGYMGILPQDVSPELAKAFNTEEKGALVGDITPNSPASKSTLQKGDIIVAVNGEPIANANDLRLKIGNMAPNSKIDLKVLRDGKPAMVTMTLGDFPTNQAEAEATPGKSNDALNGVTVENITPDVANQLKLNAGTQGVVVEQIDPSSKAADSSLQPGDVIQEVNHQAVNNTTQFNEAMRNAKAGQPVLLLINRNGETMYVAVSS
jgi:serine protease Do